MGAPVMTCDTVAVDRLVAALAGPGDPAVIAAAGWAPLCTGDGVLDAQLGQIATAKPENWWLVELQTSVLDAHLWASACKGGSRAMSMVTKLDPPLRRAHLWETCALHDLGAFDSQEWGAAQGMLVMPILAAWTLTEGGVPKEKSRPILRALISGARIP